MCFNREVTSVALEPVGLASTPTATSVALEPVGVASTPTATSVALEPVGVASTPAACSACSLDDLPALCDLREQLLNVHDDPSRLIDAIAHEQAANPKSCMGSVSTLAALLECSIFDDGELACEKSNEASASSHTSNRSTMSRNSWVSASGEGPKCFKPETVFQKYPAQDMSFVTAADLQQGSTIVGAQGQCLTVVAVKEKTTHQLVELIGSDTRFVVTPSHRMVGGDGIPVLARDLEPCQRIMYAAGQFELQEVRKIW